MNAIQTIEMFCWKRTRRLSLLTALLATLGVAGPAASTAAGLSEAELFFELNDTDEDLGIHASVDGGPYTRLEIEDKYGRNLLVMTAHGSLANQGQTQFFMESAEPSFDELDPEVFFKRFPEGTYEIEATRGNLEFEGKVKLSHVMAAPAGEVEVSGVPAVECDEAQLPVIPEPILVDWAMVTESHPDVGKDGAVEIVRYQFFAEIEGAKLAVDLPPDITEFEIPGEFLDLGDEFKYEIIARTSKGNNTAVEYCFILD